ncbi:MAG: hypothetical protein JSV49_09370 [Thermoplasmata archaeon]|nr:MAG: hypothetical protein JSV49_09370 [Thermoplasmata archaeon]
MTDKTTESEEDLKKVIAELQTQVESMRTELEEVKSSMTTIKVTPEKEPEPETKEEVIEYLKKLPGIGISKATLIYEAGFDSTSKLKDAKPEDLTEIKGIGPSLAKNICESIEKLEAGEPVSEAPKEAEAPAEGAASAEGEAEEGIIKGTMSKIFGFFKGKKPEGEAAKPEAEPPEVKAEAVEAKPEEELKEGEEAKVEAPEGEITKEEEGTDVEEKPEGEVEEKVEEPADKPAEEAEETKEEVKDVEKEPGAEVEPTIEVSSEPSTLEEPVEVSSDEPKALTKDDIIKMYQTLPGVGESTASKLYEAGYESLEELQEAEQEDLIMVEGINDKTAEAIVKALKES